LNISWIAAAGNAIFANLSMIFAIGIAIGLTGGEGAAGLAALVGFLVFNGVFNTLIPQVGGQPDPTITMGVLSGILIGLVSAGLYRRFHDIRLPDYLAFFGGRRFVPIITALVAVALGAIFGLIWPTVQTWINALGTDIVSLGALGPGIYGFLNRLLIPVGLHHVLNTYVWFQLGSFAGPKGVVHGDLTGYGPPGTLSQSSSRYPALGGVCLLPDRGHRTRRIRVSLRCPSTVCRSCYPDGNRAGGVHPPQHQDRFWLLSGAHRLRAQLY